jgi:hypothetical protein
LPALTGTTQTFGPGLTTFTVSSGICTVEVIVSGAAGGNIGGSVAGRGSSIRGQFAVAAGDKYDITVGAYRGGGAGGRAELNGGGATRVVKQSTAAVLVEAGGGGGDGYGLITRVNPAQDTIPGATTLPGGTAPPFIQFNVVPGKGADAPGTTAVSPVTASVSVPVGNVPASSTSLVPESVSATANGAGTDAGVGVLTREVAPSTTEFVASVRVDVWSGGAGGGGATPSGGADADGGSAGSIVYDTTIPEQSTTTVYTAPFAIGASVGGSGGQNFIGNGFLTLAQGVNDQINGQVILRQIACSSTGSTLPPLGGGNSAARLLLPGAIILLGAGAGLLMVRRRSRKLTADAV